MDRSIFKHLMCNGPLCSPWKNGRFSSDDILATHSALTVIEGEDIATHGWEYRNINDETIALCPDCQKEMDKK